LKLEVKSKIALAIFPVVGASAGREAETDKYLGRVYAGLSIAPNQSLLGYKRQDKSTSHDR